jgi:hypothetical protein
MGFAAFMFVSSFQPCLNSDVAFSAQSSSAVMLDASWIGANKFCTPPQVATLQQCVASGTFSAPSAPCTPCGPPAYFNTNPGDGSGNGLLSQLNVLNVCVVSSTSPTSCQLVSQPVVPFGGGSIASTVTCNGRPPQITTPACCVCGPTATNFSTWVVPASVRKQFDTVCMSTTTPSCQICQANNQNNYIQGIIALAGSCVGFVVTVGYIVKAVMKMRRNNSVARSALGSMNPNKP